MKCPRSLAQTELLFAPATQMAEQLVEVQLVSASECALNVPVPQTGNELVVEVPKIVSHPMFSAAFVERSSRFPPGTGSPFREQNIEVIKVFSPDRVQQRCVVKRIKVIKVFAQDRVQQRFVEQNTKIIKVFWSRTSRS